MRLQSLEAERDQRHTDLGRAMLRLKEAVIRCGPPPTDRTTETVEHRIARAAAKAYAERWELFCAATAAVEREIEDLNRCVARHPAGGML
jgi:hypothetical protein